MHSQEGSSSSIETRPPSPRTQAPTANLLRRQFNVEAPSPKRPNETYIDTLFDFEGFLKLNPYLGTIPEHLIGTEVGIVGTGASALTAGFELLKVGLKPVFFELTERIGGRFESRHFHNEKGEEVSAFSELGPMRFPKSGKVFWHYVNQFNLEIGDDKSPVPGTVPTKLYFEGDVIDWPAGTKEPNHPLLQRVAADWDNFFNPLLQPLREASETGDVEQMAKIWQGYLTKYKDQSLFNVLADVTKVSNGEKWGPEEKELFGSLGTGIGGLSPYFDTGFIEILRDAFNKMYENLYALPDGAESFTTAFYNARVKQANGNESSLNESAEVNLNTKVTGITLDLQSNRPVVQFKTENGEIAQRQFKAVIVATTPPTMQVMHLGMKDATREESKQVLSKEVRRALGNVSMSAASKDFFRTKGKFWKKNPDLPQAIYGSQLLKSLYCFDQPKTDNGVVCINYSWANDSVKLQSLKPEERLSVVKGEIQKMDPQPDSWASKFSQHLEPLKDASGKPEIHSIDWQSDPRSMGAFKSTKPGQERYVHKLYYQFMSVKKDDPQPDSGVYLAGSSISWPSGWVEGALHKGIETACSVIQRVGGQVAKGSPLEQNPNRYRYE